MCLGGGGGSNDAKKIQRRNEELEEARQARIREGQAIINENFARFDQPFFDSFKSSFLDFFNPQLDDQANAARGRGLAALVDRGISESTEGIRAQTDIQKRDALERTNLANRAIDESNKLRAGVEREKTNLFALNETAADPSRIAPLAAGGARAFVAPAAFSPLEDVFASTLSNVAAFQAARNNATAPVARRTFAPSGVANPSGSGFVRG